MLVYQSENFGDRYEFRTNTHENWDVLPHLHQFCEIAFTKTGTTTVYIDRKKHLVPAGHLVFILPNQIHAYSSETASTLRSMSLS